jgi:hypothetical protein
LLEKYWEACFDKKLHTSISNRYLFTAHGQTLLLPYVPHTLHKKWMAVNIDLRDDCFVASFYGKYFDLNVFTNNKKRFERFPGWQKKILKNSMHDYIKYICQHQSETVPINLTKKISDLSKEEEDILKKASALLHAIFPTFTTTVEL